MLPASSPARLPAVAVSSGLLALLGVLVEAAAAGLAITPFVARLSGSAWAPFLAAAALFSVAGSPLGRRAFVAAPFGVAGAAALGLGMAAAGQGALAGTGPAFAAVVVAGEAFAVGALLAGGSEALAAGVSLFSGALVASVIALFGDRLDVVMAPGGVALGGAVALVQLALFRYGDGAVGQRFGDKDTVPAAVARLTEAPRRLILAVLGQQPV